MKEGHFLSLGRSIKETESDLPGISFTVSRKSSMHRQMFFCPRWRRKGFFPVEDPFSIRCSNDKEKIEKRWTFFIGWAVRDQQIREERSNKRHSLHLFHSKERKSSRRSKKGEKWHEYPSLPFLSRNDSIALDICFCSSSTWICLIIEENLLNWRMLEREISFGIGHRCSESFQSPRSEDERRIISSLIEKRNVLISNHFSNRRSTSKTFSTDQFSQFSSIETWRKKVLSLFVLVLIRSHSISADTPKFHWPNSSLHCNFSFACSLFSFIGPSVVHSHWFHFLHVWRQRISQRKDRQQTSTDLSLWLFHHSNTKDEKRIRVWRENSIHRRISTFQSMFFDLAQVRSSQSRDNIDQIIRWGESESTPHHSSSHFHLDLDQWTDKRERERHSMEVEHFQREILRQGEKISFAWSSFHCGEFSSVYEDRTPCSTDTNFASDDRKRKETQQSSERIGTSPIHWSTQNVSRLIQIELLQMKFFFDQTFPRALHDKETNRRWHVLPRSNHPPTHRWRRFSLPRSDWMDKRGEGERERDGIKTFSRKRSTASLEGKIWGGKDKDASLSGEKMFDLVKGKDSSSFAAVLRLVDRRSAWTTEAFFRLIVSNLFSSEDFLFSATFGKKSGDENLGRNTCPSTFRWFELTSSFSSFRIPVKWNEKSRRWS